MINKNLANHSNVTLLKQNKKGEKMNLLTRFLYNTTIENGNGAAAIQRVLDIRGTSINQLRQNNPNAYQAFEDAVGHIIYTEAKQGSYGTLLIDMYRMQGRDFINVRAQTRLKNWSIARQMLVNDNDYHIHYNNIQDNYILPTISPDNLVSRVQLFAPILFIIQIINFVFIFKIIPIFVIISNFNKFIKR